jgi:hypothetical protein
MATMRAHFKMRKGDTMAGSYNHCVAKDGQLLVNEDLIQMVENLGDAYEALEEMYGMIWYLAAATSAQQAAVAPVSAAIGVGTDAIQQEKAKANE